MTKIEWCVDYCLKIAEIDKLHIELVNMLNQLIEERQTISEESNIPELLSNLIDHVRYLFRNEESYLIQYRFPDFKEHRKQHGEFLKKTIACRRLFSDQNISYLDSFIDDCKSWIASHILKCDMEYAPFIRIQLYLDQYEKLRFQKRFR
ncbi:MAG: hemerythrin family protein [Desulfobacterales bacterium]|nr:hemerythrin family protein [Desulfobacterales bacterium]